MTSPAEGNEAVKLFPVVRDRAGAGGQELPEAGGTEGNAAWRSLRRRYPDVAFLDEDPAYSLAERVLDAIDESLPGFFTPEQRRFERELAWMTGGGFFLRRVIVRPVAPCFEPDLTVDEWMRRRWSTGPASLRHRPAPAAKPEAFGEARSRDLVEQARAIRRDLLRLQNLDTGDFDAEHDQLLDEWAVIDRRAEAYAGWLVLNPQFRRELAELRAANEAAVARRGGFPRRDDGAAADRDSEHRDDCVTACRAFYRRWCLDRMLTWDLPVPLDPRIYFLDAAARLDRDEGVTVMLPWPALRGERLDLRKVVERVRSEHAPEHLREWLRHASDREGRHGEVTYQRLYWLYRAYELVLFRRYPAACRGNLTDLDRALAAAMGRKEDLIKRLRQRLMRERQLDLSAPG